MTEARQQLAAARAEASGLQRQAQAAQEEGRAQLAALEGQLAAGGRKLRDAEARVEASTKDARVSEWALAWQRHALAAGNVV